MKLDSMDICCNLVEIQYIDNMKKLLNLINLNDFEIRKNLFPDEWNYIENKELKLLMLKEALDKNIILSETELVRDYYKKL